jgi:hypothetical protein
MAAATVLAILVLTGETQRPELAALLSAANEVVSAADAVRVVETPKISDAEALRVERDLSATAVVQLSWSDAGRQRARLRLHAGRTNRWIDRELQFAVDDTPSERGRTLGFAIASMLPEGDPELKVGTAQRTSTPSEQQAPATMGRHAVGASLVGAAGLGGPAAGIGGALRAETMVTERTSIGIKAAVRRGEIPELEAGSLTVIGGAGATFQWLEAGGSLPLGLAARADALLVYHAVSHAGPTSETLWKGHLMPGAALGVEATWRITHGLELVLGGGLEVAIGTVDVTVVAAPPAAGHATIPAARAVAEAGVRMRF